MKSTGFIATPGYPKREVNRGMNITVFVPCYVDACYPGVGIAMVGLLERLGHDLKFHPELTCCGQPAFNAGCWDEARKVAARNVDVLTDAEAVVVPSGSCAAMMRKFYPELFHGHPQESEASAVAGRCHELSSFIADTLGITDVGASFPHRVTFHDGCHGMRELGIKTAPRKLLADVKELELIEMEDSNVCCGFGGTFAVKFPSISTAMGETKIGTASETGAEYIVSNDVSCLMHIGGLLKRRNDPLKTIHLAEVLVQT